MERPYYGYFCEVKVHHTDRPRPEVVKREVYPNTPAEVVDEPQQPAKFGNRKHFFNWVVEALLAQHYCVGTL